MSLFLRVAAYIRPYWKHLSVAVICTILFTVFSGATVWLLTPLMKTVFTSDVVTATNEGVDESSPESTIEGLSGQTPGLARLKDLFKARTYSLLIGESKLDSLKRLCFAILLIIFLKNLFFYLQAYFMAFLKQGIVKDVRDALFRHLQSLSLHYFHGRRTGQLISRVTNDTVALQDTINVSFSTLIRDPLLILVYLTIVILINWKLTLVVLAVLPFSLLVISKIGRKLRKYSVRSLEKIGNITSILQETFSGIRVVKAFGMEKVEISKFTSETGRYFRTMLKMVRVRTLAGPVNEFLGTAAGVVVLWYGGRQVLRGEMMAPEDFMTYVFAIFLLMQPIKSLAKVHNQIQQGLAAAQRIFAVLDTVPRIQESSAAVDVMDFRDSIRFRDVVFQYDTGGRVLDHIDVEIHQGEIVALVGASGVGKSTLADLLPRFYDPQEGAVELDGVDLRHITISSLRGLLGIVTQETILFNDTIFNNIAYGSERVTRKLVEEAARAANADEFILGLSEGYETFIGDRGAKLSGGQRQRIAIARALLKDPKILILDEATSALDSESEISVQQALERLMKDRTTLVIAHRLSTVQNADRIVVLEKGTVVQEGSHEDLIRQEGVYKKLYKLQFQQMSLESSP
ncbi:ABC transporter ATP-binding protein [bacterium]|nr:ABC transporter ATP-binding protein [bacterium]